MDVIIKGLRELDVEFEVEKIGVLTLVVTESKKYWVRVTSSSSINVNIPEEIKNENFGFIFGYFSEDDFAGNMPNYDNARFMIGNRSGLHNQKSISTTEFEFSLNEIAEEIKSN